MRVPPPKLRPGDDIVPWLEKIRQWVIRNTFLGIDAGLTAQQTDVGFTIGAVIPDIGEVGSVGVVQSGGISARVTTTPGSGNVTLYKLNTAGTTLVTTGITVVVKNFSSTTGGVASGTYVFVQQDADGIWWLVSVDCGN